MRETAKNKTISRTMTSLDDKKYLPNFIRVALSSFYSMLVIISQRQYANNFIGLTTLLKSSVDGREQGNLGRNWECLHFITLLRYNNIII